MKIKVYVKKKIGNKAVTQCARVAHFPLVDACAALQPTKKKPHGYWWIKSSLLVIGQRGLVKWYLRPLADC